MGPQQLPGSTINQALLQSGVPGYGNVAGPPTPFSLNTAGLTNGGVQGYYNPMPQTSSNVLGTNTQTQTQTTNNPPPPANNNNNGGGRPPSGSGGYNVNDVVSFGGQQYRYTGNSSEGIGGWVPTGGGGADQGAINAQNFNAQVDAVYDPVKSGLQNLISTSYPAEQASRNTAIDEAFNTQAGLLPGQRQTLQNQEQQNEFQFNNQAQSALDNATRSFNALRQQAMGFGGSSLGQAMGELAQQEAQRSQGDIQQQQGLANLQFGGQKLGIENFIQDKTSQLNLWKTQAQEAVRKWFTDAVTAANNEISMNDSQRAAAKVNTLNQALNFNRQIEAADVEFQRRTQLLRDLNSSQDTNLNSIANRQLALQGVVFNNGQNTQYQPVASVLPNIAAVGGTGGAALYPQTRIDPVTGLPTF